MGSKRKPVKREPATGKDNLVPAEGWKRDYTVAPPHGEAQPRPMKALVGAVFFMDSEGNIDEEAWEKAKANAEADYIRRCEERGIEP